MSPITKEKDNKKQKISLVSSASYVETQVGEFEETLFKMANESNECQD